jgi:hypothetical protein
MDESRMDDMLQVLLEENNLLTAPYSEDKLRMAIFQMEHNKALGLNGLLLEFNQTLCVPLKQMF